MPIEIRATAIAAVKLILPSQVADARGFFSETYRVDEFAAAGVDLQFVQDNHSLSVEPHTVRGLHYQAHPFAQAKLVRVIRGANLRRRRRSSRLVAELRPARLLRAFRGKPPANARSRRLCARLLHA